jgi:uncharacterized membrane protein YgcG
MRHRSIGYLGALALTLATMWLPSAAQALDCDSVVSDDTGKLNASGVASIVAAAGAIENLGGVVRVRLVDDYGAAGSLTALAEKVYVPSCRSWQASGGGVRGNLLVIMVELKHHGLAILPGAQLTPAFTGVQDARIRGEIMKPRLIDGDFAGAFVAALNQSAHLVDAYEHPAPVVQQGGGSTTIINQAPSDYSGFVHVLGLAILAVVVIFLLVFLIRLLASHREENEKRRAAQRAAQTSMTSVAGAINAFSLNVLTAQINTLASQSSDADVAHLRTDLTSVAQTQQAISADFTRLSGISKNDPLQDGLGATEYAQMKVTFDSLQRRVDDSNKSFAELQSKVAQLVADADNAPKLVAAAEQAITNGHTASKAAAGNGFKIEGVNATLTEAEQLLGGAKEGITAKKFSAAASKARAAAVKAKEAADTAAGFAAVKQAIDKKLSDLDLRGGNVSKLAVEARQVFVNIETTYAQSCWEASKGNGTEADNRLGAANKALQAAKVAAGMEVQDWAQASKLADAAFVSLDDAEHLLHGILDLRDSLEDAKKRAQPQIDSAQAEIDKAAKYVSDNKDDVEAGLNDKLDKARAHLADAKKALAVKMPDYIFVVRTAIAAGKEADAILDLAQKEHETAARMRKRADDTLQEAQRAVNTAKRYIDAHDSDVKNAARIKLSDATASLTKAKGAKTVADKIRFAEAADQAAEAALSKAKSNVDDEEERIRRRRDDDDSGSNTIVIGNIGGRSTSWGSPSSGDDTPSIPIGGGGGGGFGGGESSWGSSTPSFGGGESNW